MGASRRPTKWTNIVPTQGHSIVAMPMSCTYFKRTVFRPGRTMYIADQVADPQFQARGFYSTCRPTRSWKAILRRACLPGLCDARRTHRTGSWSRRTHGEIARSLLDLGESEIDTLVAAGVLDEGQPDRDSRTTPE